VHDLLTRSTVQIRDPAKALPSHYSRERVELSSPGMPSRWRRIVVIVPYLIASYIVVVLVVGGLYVSGLVSRACMHDYDRCSAGQFFLMVALNVAWLVGMAFCIGLGWRGRLWGARRRAETV
jgi:hypothetical protein